MMFHNKAKKFNFFLNQLNIWTNMKKINLKKIKIYIFNNMCSLIILILNFNLFQPAIFELKNGFFEQLINNII